MTVQKLFYIQALCAVERAYTVYTTVRENFNESTVHDVHRILLQMRNCTACSESPLSCLGIILLGFSGYGLHGK